MQLWPMRIRERQGGPAGIFWGRGFLPNPWYVILLIICGFCSTPVVWRGFRKIAVNQSVLCRALTVLSYAVLLGASTASLVNASYNPFLYFRF